MRRLVLFAALLAFCADAQAQSPDAGSIPEAEIARVTAALASPARSMAHRIRDETRDPVPILALLQAAPGDRVLDIGSGGGYLAMIASALVGETGHVDIHNTPGWINQFPSMDPDALARGIRSANIGYVTAAWDRIEEEPESYDAIVMGQVYHDAVLEGANFEAMNQSLFAMLKPGGVLVIEDHAADPDMPAVQQVALHRIAMDLVIEHMTRAGFVEQAAVTLPSSHDDMRFNVFRPGIRGRTSRYILAFSKPG